MKFKWTDDITAKVVSGSVIVIIGILFYYLLNNISGIFSVISSVLSILAPFIVGFVIAYLLTRPVNALERFFNRHLFKKSKKQHSINRAISIAVCILGVLLLFSLVMYTIIPQLIDSVTALARNADGYFRSANSLLNSFLAKFKLDPDFLTSFLGSSQEIFKKVTEYFAASLPKILGFSVSVGSGIYNFFIGFILSIYMLSGKERFSAQLKKLSFALLHKDFAERLIRTGKSVHETFGKYFSCQILDSILLGTICFIAMSIFGMEYALLISMIITITNFIPFIGPIIGAVPSAFILFMVNPIKALWFIVLIIVLQQLDGNLFVPKIVGKTTGLSPFWVIFAIIVFGGLFGVAGVFLAVPLFSVIYTFVKTSIELKLEKKGLPQKTREYYSEKK